MDRDALRSVSDSAGQKGARVMESILWIFDRLLEVGLCAGLVAIGTLIVVGYGWALR